MTFDTIFTLTLAAFGLFCCLKARTLQRWAVNTSGMSAFGSPIFLWWNRLGGIFVCAASIYRLFPYG